jgi:hypothetical protein
VHHLRQATAQYLVLLEYLDNSLEVPLRDQPELRVR